MKKQPTVEQMFEYCSGSINLVGFNNSPILKKVCTTLAQEISYKNHVREVYGKKVVMPNFSYDYSKQRQEFFQTLPKGLDINTSVFEREFPKAETSRFSSENFLYFCDYVYSTLQSLRAELKPFKHIPVARNIIRRLQDFDGGLEATLKTLKVVEENHTFAFDTNNGVIVNINKMPPEAENLAYLANKFSIRREDNLDKFKINMKKSVLAIAKQGKADFKERIIQYVKDEFNYNPELKNVRAYFEQLAVPVRLHTKYQRFLEKCIDRIDRAIGNDEFEGVLPQIDSPIYPQFGKNYNITNLFPPSLLHEWKIPESPVPINFKTKQHENKFLIAGLHSGGKSFFLENLVLASLLGQIPLPLCADSLVLPKYNKISYYRNIDNGSLDGSGKAVKEIRDINSMINNAGKGDLLVFDEFLDSTTAGVATWIGPELLGRLARLKDTTVFVSTHRSHDYKKLEKNGWVILSPAHRIEEGKVVPAHRIERGKPNERINKRYVREKYEEEQKS